MPPVFFDAPGAYVSGLNGFSLRDTFTCGQCFRWEEQPGGSYRGVALGRVLQVRMEGDFLLLEGVSPKEYQTLWRRYFDLDRDYSLVKSRLSRLDPALEEACRNAPGIRVLRQDPWEALCTFIISQNNNIPRITGIVRRFCQTFGRELSPGAFDFPVPKALADLQEEDLAPLRCGFRAKYLLDAARRVSCGQVDLERISTLPLWQAQEALMQIHGVGPKVADCVLLYGMGRTDAFPMDVWMKRAMALLFPGKTPDYFGADAGIAQQYLFHYCRTQKLRQPAEEMKKRTG